MRGEGGGAQWNRHMRMQGGGGGGGELFRGCRLSPPQRGDINEISK